MRIVSVFACLLILFAAAPTTAQTAEERAQLQWVLERGRLLFELDRAAWVGTDDMFTRVRDPATTGIRGYVVELEGDGYQVIFYGGPEEAPVAFYRGRIENRRVVSREIFPVDSRPPLTSSQRRLVSVREASARLGRRPCGSAAFNTVVVPSPAPDGPADLYLLTPQTRGNVFPFGGHFRATIAADGAVSSSRAFTNSCLDITTEGEEGRAEGLVITHLLDPLPTEIHVFLSISTGLPVYVGTGPDRVWEVEDSAIRLVNAPR